MITGVEILNVINTNDKLSHQALNADFNKFNNNDAIAVFNNFIKNNLKNTKNRIMNEVIANVINTVKDIKSVKLTKTTIDFNKLLPKVIENFVENDKIFIAKEENNNNLNVSNGMIVEDVTQTTKDILEAELQNPQIKTDTYAKWAETWFGISGDNGDDVKKLTEALKKDFTCHSSRSWR